MLHRADPDPPAPRRVGRTVLLTAFLLAALPATPSYSQDEPPTVTGLSPASGEPGDVIQILGQGFGNQPEDLFAWIDTGDSGFAFEIEAAIHTALSAQVAAVATASTGGLQLWTGRTYHPADRTFLVQGRVVSTSGADLFIAGQKIQGPIFSALSASPRTVAARLVAGRIRLSVETIDVGDGPHTVRVTAIIETGGNPGSQEGPRGTRLRAGNATDGSTGASPGAAWALTLDVDFDRPPADGEALAEALARVLEAQLEDLGLTATASGTEVVLSHPLGIRSGSVIVSG